MQVHLPVITRLPGRISRIPELAHNLWWTWKASARELFRRLDLDLWKQTAHNPIRMIRQVDAQSLRQAARNPQFLALYDSVMDDFDSYMSENDSWFSTHYPDRKDEVIAYFCAEFGIHNSLPIYSGGLGILAGDTCKEASDLGIPLVGIGSLYPEGYFKQRIDPGGRQSEVYARLDMDNVPLLPVLDDDGKRLLISLPLDASQVSIALWKVQVGRVPIFLMDTDIEENQPWQRDLIARLYHGDQVLRLRQEIILGMGGVKTLHTLGFRPTVFHLNEGHAAFTSLELMRQRAASGLSFSENLAGVRKQIVFTTHTPVGAGHDEFPFPLVEEYFESLWEELGASRQGFLELGQVEDRQAFSMTVLALRTSRAANGVSAKHGQVTRRMWHGLWPDLPVEQVPIGSITNGVHLPTWVSSEIGSHFRRRFGPHWLEDHDDPAPWEGVASIPDSDLWAAHVRLKTKLLNFARERARQKWLQGGASAQQLVGLGCFLNPGYLTLGFARRFATYKRATLILRDRERLSRILVNSKRPIQILFAGKAHPVDEEGKHFLQQIFEAGSSNELRGHIAVIEDYDMHVAHFLLAGVDVWLNTPVPPLEASGTSGQKAAMNGVVNFSVLDGWWAEGFNGHNGWDIGGEDDDATASALYDRLEGEIAPLFYDRDSVGIPVRWVSLMRESIRSIAADFSARRMMKEYCRKMYAANHSVQGP